MKLIDISQTLEKPMAGYPSLPSFERKWLRHYQNGDENAVSQITMAVHNGTHMDAPYHYCESGRKILEVELERYYGLCQVIEVPQEYKSISLDFVEQFEDLAERVLFKTSNSALRYEDKKFHEDFVFLEGNAAAYLIEKGVKLIGIDYCSIDGRGTKGKPAHHAILDHDGSILEGINLTHVEAGNYILSCLPIKIDNIEGSPCRAILISE